MHLFDIKWCATHNWPARWQGGTQCYLDRTSAHYDGSECVVKTLLEYDTITARLTPENDIEIVSAT